jgi:uncharacterized membrane protein
MSSEVTALLASLSFALFAVYGWLGLRHSTPLTATIVSLAARTITLGTAVILFGGVPGFAMKALVVFIILGLIRRLSVCSRLWACKKSAPHAASRCVIAIHCGVLS